MEELNSRYVLEQSILLLEELLLNGETDEEKYQRFFEKNPVVFRILGYRQFLSFTKQSGRNLPRDVHSGLKPEPDFLAERENGLWEIFEIKTPVAKQLMVDSNKYRERFTSEVISYISQTITYEKYFTRNPLNRKAASELYSIDIHEDLDIKIVIGLNEQIDRVKIHQKCRELKYKIDIITYDDILNRLKEEHSRVFGIYENLPGFSFHFVIQISKWTKNRKSYIFDTGNNSNQNRISFYIEENGDLCFRVMDNFQKTYEVSADRGQFLNQWIYLVCEFGKTTDGFIMTLGINGREKDKRVKDTIVDVELPLQLKTATLGCDLSQQYFGYFNLARKIIYSQTLTFEVKHALFNRISTEYHNLRKIGTWVAFNGRQFMYLDKKGLIPDK